MAAKSTSPLWEIYPRYAEEPMITFRAKDLAAAERKAEKLAEEGRASGGYRPGGSLCPMRVRTQRRSSR